MVLIGRFELPTSPLPRVRSTTEPRRHIKCESPCHRPIILARGSRKLYAPKGLFKSKRMSKSPKYYDTHQEKLAKALRDNLKKRRAQKSERIESAENTPTEQKEEKKS